MIETMSLGSKGKVGLESSTIMSPSGAKVRTAYFSLKKIQVP